jgi:hypothetical protein
VRGAHEVDDAQVVLAQLGQHVLRRDEGRVVVQQALVARDVADGAQRGAAELARALGNGVGHGEDLVRLLVQHQVVVAKVRPRHVPVEVLGLQVQREGVGQQGRQATTDVAARFGAERGGRVQGRLAARGGGFERDGHGSAFRSGTGWERSCIGLHRVER